MTVLCERRGAVARLTLNRPDSLNAFNARMRADLLAEIEALEQDPDVRIVLLAGAGRCFSAGTDLKEGLHADVTDLLEKEYMPPLRAITQSDKLYIAQAQGAVSGIGAAFMFSCDLAVMAEDACIFMAFANIALVPDGGNTWHLVQAMGPKHALALIAEGGRLSAQDCLAYGMVNTLVPEDQLADTAWAWAERLAQAAPLALRGAKQLVRAVPGQSLEQTQSAEAKIQGKLVQSQDFRRGVAAFTTKTPPMFEGN